MRSPPPSYQLHLQASTITGHHLSLAVREPGHAHRGKAQGMTALYLSFLPQLLTAAQGFDEFMNLVIDDAIEVKLAKKDAPEERRKVGQILLKGDNISLIQQL